MITINNKKFSKNSNEFVDSLFHPGGTSVGFYKVMKKGVLFFDMHKAPFAFLCANDPRTCFFVSCSLVNGKILYNYGLGDKTKFALGFTSADGYLKEVETANAIWRSVTTPAAPAQNQELAK